MQLTREAIQRMVGTGGMVMGGGGGEGGGISADFLSQNYVAIPYFSQLFTIHGKQTTTVDGEVTDEQDITLPPNTMPSRTETTEGGVTTVIETTITRIEALFDFNSVGGVSALGYNPGGGGGGADLNKLLDSINSSSIGDIAPTASEVGKCLVYNGNNQWTWATPGGGGGLTYGLSWSYGSVSGAQGGSYDGSAIKSFIIPNDTSHLSNGAGFITSSALSGYLPLTGGTMTGSIIMKGVNIYMDPANSSSNATPDIVFRYGNGSEKARIWVDESFSSELGPQFRIYNTAGTQIVSTRLALASQIPSLVGYATQQWVNDQNFLTEDQYKGTVTKVSAGTGITTNPSTGITSSGTVSISGTYQTYISHGESAYNSLSNYLLKSDGMMFLDYGTYIRAQFNPDGGRAALAQGSGYIEWWASGGYFNHHVGNVEIGSGTTDTSHYIQIGGGRIYWDYQSKSLYVVQSDGSTPANIYATGGVSALGISTGGTPSVSELTVGTLKGVRYLQNASGAVSITSGNSYIYIGAGSGSNVYIADSSNTYFDTSGHLHLTGKRLYLDSTRYVYVSNSHLYFYNGSSSVQIV